MTVKIGDTIQHPDDDFTLTVTFVGGDSPTSDVIITGNDGINLQTSQGTVERTGFEVVEKPNAT